MRRVLATLTLMLVGSNLLLADTDEDRFNELKNKYYELKQDKKKRNYRVYWSRIAKELISLSEKAEPRLKVRVYFILGELFRDLRRITLSPYDFESAIEYYKKVFTEFPDSNLADDALYYTGKLYLEVENDTDTAIKYFRMIKERYPKGDFYDKAITLLNSVPYSERTEGEKKKEVVEEKEELDNGKKPTKKEVSEEEAEKARAQELATLIDIKIKAGEKGAICELLTSRQIRYLYKELPEDVKAQKPPRIYIDLIDTKLGEGLSRSYSIDKGFLKAIRLGQFADNTVRIVFDLSSIQTYLIYADENPYRIVMHFGETSDIVPLNVSKEERQKSEPTERPTEGASISSKEEDLKGEKEKGGKIIESLKSDLKRNTAERKTDTIPLSKQLGLKVKRVVIDPGHGGEDQGAVGRSGLKEKDVVLDIALELAKIFKKKTDIEVILTRDSDVTVKLSERAAIAREKKADLFISIHANANKNKKFSGVEVYYLNNTDDRASQKVAMLENLNSDKSISDLKMTLLDLAISANVDESMRLAHYIQSSIIEVLRKRYPDVKDRGVKYALFYVLFGTEIPSVLIETSFISNPVEEKRLKSKEYRRLIAQGIFEGIMKYINVGDE